MGADERPRRGRSIRRAAHVPDGVFRDPWAWIGTSGLVLLLAYLIGRQAVDPGFTEYWGYMAAQIGATVLILHWLNAVFAREGGLALLTFAVVTVETWIDALGNIGRLYNQYASYDKIVHFGGGVMLTAGAADVLWKLQRRKGWRLSAPVLLAWAVTAAMLLNVGWELYEVAGDRLFATGRNTGNLDTAYDLVSDLVGAVVIAAILGRRRALGASTAPHRGHEGAYAAAEGT